MTITLKLYTITLKIIYKSNNFHNSVENRARENCFSEEKKYSHKKSVKLNMQHFYDTKIIKSRGFFK